MIVLETITMHHHLRLHHPLLHGLVADLHVDTFLLIDQGMMNFPDHHPGKEEVY